METNSEQANPQTETETLEAKTTSKPTEQIDNDDETGFYYA